MKLSEWTMQCVCQQCGRQADQLTVWGDCNLVFLSNIHYYIISFYFNFQFMFQFWVHSLRLSKRDNVSLQAVPGLPWFHQYTIYVCRCPILTSIRIIHYHVHLTYLSSRREIAPTQREIQLTAQDSDSSMTSNENAVPMS